ncbi:T9SS type B sorting domain-containing protein [Halpernia sp.]|uniref:T9SS type B sorting domain-containing protein n=1 Tax=Halpernia sp. TaxID=2782209 RepID=UPI003A8DDB3E
MKKYLLFYVLFMSCLLVTIKAQNSSVPKITDLAGNENPIIDCNYPLNGGCLSLTASYPKFYETSNYEVNAEDYKPNGAFNDGTPLNANVDDLFLKKVVIPFNFCFFNNNYNEVIIGSNGVITFNSNQLGNINYPNIQTTNPNPSLPLNSIFGVAQDLIFSQDNDSEIYYSVIGAAPCRKLVINFYKGRMVGCNQTSTSQVVLNECSGEIEIFIDEKPLPCSESKFKESLIGIINSDASVGISPPGRNTGIWEADKEAWKFTPNGAEITPQISWFDENNKNIGTGNTITVCPEKNQKYNVKVSYLLCGNNNLVLEDSTDVSFAADFPLAKDFTTILCGKTPINVNLDDFTSNLTPQISSNLIFSFHNSLAEAQTGTNPQPKSFQLNDNKVFYVRVQNPTDPTCFRTSVLKLNLISKSLLTSEVEICDTNNDGVENDFVLSILNSKLFNSPLSGTVHYFTSKENADNNLNEITTANLVNNSKFYIKYITPSCSQTFGPINISFLPAPAINTPIDFAFKTCDYLNDHTEPFDFLLNIAPLISTDPTVTFKFYSTYEQAFAGNGSEIGTIKEGKYSVFVRVEFPGGCFSVGEIKLDITFTKIEAKDSTIFICFDGTQDITVNLNDYTQDMLINPLTGISITYYLTQSDAEEDKNAISNLYEITDDGNFVRKTIFVKFSDSTDCYALKKLTINLVHVIIAKSQFDICDFNNDGTESVNLGSLNTQIIGSQNAAVTYYLTSSDAQNDTNSISTYQLINTGKLFVKITSYGCSDVFEINLKLTSTPVVNSEITEIRNSVCDNNNDGQESFDLTQLQPKIYTGSDPVSFTFYTSYNESSHSFSGLISTPQNYLVKATNAVFSKVTFLNGGCYSATKINLQLNFLPTIVLKSAVLEKCDFDFNLNESFNLNDAIPQLFTQSENTISLSDITISYYVSEADANAGIASTQINSTYISTHSKETVWVRFTSKITSCYSVTSILLDTYLPPKALKSVINDICDDNLDGLYDVNLNAFTDGMVNQNSSDNKFSFYYTESDAKTSNNAIPNPESFSANPLPTKLWVRVENIPGCFDTTSIDLNTGTKVVLDNSGPFTITNTCDIGNDGVENVDLTQFQNQIYSKPATFEYYPSVLDINNNTNKISNPSAYLFNENSGPKKIFAKVIAPNFCPNLVEINLTLKKTPIFSLPDYYFCPDGFVDIKPDFSGLNIVSFEWLNPSGEIVSTNSELLNAKTEGVYKINVTAANGCTFSTNFNVKMYEVPIITELIPNNDNYTVIATGSKTILYSIDGIHFQISNVFNDLPEGVVTFYVKFEGSDCLGKIKKGLILHLTNVFTPNGDGINDTWIIDNLYVFEGKVASLKIFDRYQKLVYQQESNTRLEWNGKELARNVYTNSYWYILTLPDGRVFTGWVVLKNRN